LLACAHPLSNQASSLHCHPQSPNPSLVQTPSSSLYRPSPISKSISGPDSVRSHHGSPFPFCHESWMRPPLSAASRRARFPLLLWGSRLVHDLRDAPESWSEILHLPQGRIREGPEIQIPHQPGSPEYTLHRSISEKFTIRRFLLALMQIQATWSLNLLLLWNQSPMMM